MHGKSTLTPVFPIYMFCMNGFMVIIKVANITCCFFSLIKVKAYLAPAIASLKRDSGVRKCEDVFNTHISINILQGYNQRIHIIVLSS